MCVEETDNAICCYECSFAEMSEMCTSYETEAAVLSTKYQVLQGEWNKQQENLGRLQGEVYELRNTLMAESTYCAALGATLGNLIWKASRLPLVVETLLDSQLMPDFFDLVSSTVVSFMNQNSRTVPEVDSDETQFVLSMCGIATNIAAVPVGREFILNNVDGVNMVSLMMRKLPMVPPVSGDPFRTLLLMFFFNLSIDRSALRIIQTEKDMLTTLSQFISSNRSPELKILSLKILESITADVPNAQILCVILRCVPKRKIEPLTGTADAEIRQYACYLMENIKKAEELTLGSPFMELEPKDKEEIKKDTTITTCRM